MTRRFTKRTPRRDSTITVTVSGCSDGLKKSIRRAAREAVREEGVGAGRLDIAVVVDREMKRLHRAWMGTAATTDVLTFDLTSQNVKTSNRRTLDGQIVVCETVARARSRAGRGDWRAELLLYVVHGCLHLCGYDDHRARDSARMHRREDEILTRLGHGAVYSEA